MPELPEVEVTRQGVAPHILGRRVEAVEVRNPALRWPVPNLAGYMVGTVVKTVARRGKFILISCEPELAVARCGMRAGTLLVHLGMTGTLRIHMRDVAVRAHDHVDIVFGDTVLRYHDPRRFGALLWHPGDAGSIGAHPQLANLGVEPLGADFEGEAGGHWLYRASRGRTVAIKQFILAGHAVVGVGNIYVSEALFRARIHPETAAGRISLARYQRLAEAIRLVLAAAIEKGGSSLRDFVASDGSSGYFQQEYFVYGRTGLPCRVCGTQVRVIRQGQRSSFYCVRCQR